VACIDSAGICRSSSPPPLWQRLYYLRSFLPRASNRRRAFDVLVTLPPITAMSRRNARHSSPAGPSAARYAQQLSPACRRRSVRNHNGCCSARTGLVGVALQRYEDRMSAVVALLFCRGNQPGGSQMSARRCAVLEGAMARQWRNGRLLFMSGGTRWYGALIAPCSYCREEVAVR